MIPVPLILFGASIVASWLRGEKSEEFGAVRGQGGAQKFRKTYDAPASMEAQVQEQEQQQAAAPAPPREKTAEEALDEVMREIDSTFMTDAVGDDVMDSMFEDVHDSENR